MWWPITGFIAISFVLWRRYLAERQCFPNGSRILALLGTSRYATTSEKINALVFTIFVVAGCTAMGPFAIPLIVAIILLVQP
jgi:hypothetical protein